MPVNPSGSEFRVNTTINSNQRNDRGIAMDADGDFVVTWTSYGQDGSGSGVYGQRYSAAGIAQGGEFRVNSTIDGSQLSPAVAMDADGDFVVTWLSFGNADGVYGQRYTAAGIAQGSEFRVNSTTSEELNSTVAMDADGDFVIAWTSYYDGIYAQRYSSAGVAQGSEFRVNPTTDRISSSSTVAMDADGDFVISWSSGYQDGDGDGYGIYAQRYSAAGVAQGGEFRVNSFTTDDQRSSAIAMDADGDFVVTWSSFGQDGDSSGVYGQRYSAAGIAQGGEFRVNSFTTDDQRSSAVAMDADGDFVVTWTSYGQDGSGPGVYGQRYSAAGIAQEGEFQVNSFTIGTQESSAVAIDADGDFAVVWTSYGQDGDGSGVYAQRYDTTSTDNTPPAQPLAPTLVVGNDSGISNSDRITNQTRPTLSGVTEVSSTVQVFDGVTSLGTTTTNVAGNWSFTPTTALTNGTHIFTLTATDVAGNTSARSPELNLTVDTVAPTAVIADITPEFRETSVSAIVLQFSEAVGNFDLSDLALTRDSSPLALTGAILTPSLDNRSWTLTLPDSITATDGRYQITLTQGSFTDIAGNVAILGASDSWLTGRTATALPAIIGGGRGGARIRGTNRSETLRDTSKNDILVGLGGNDVLFAGKGNDVLDGGKGKDRLVGGAGNDLLTGGSSNDLLIGGKGNDVLVGGVGRDTLTGSAGQDAFVFTSLSEGVDVITDFNSSQDLIDLRPIMSRPEFGGSNGFARFTQFVQLQQVGANTEVRVDADGSGVGQTFTTLATLQNTALSAVSARNFVIA